CLSCVALHRALALPFFSTDPPTTEIYPLSLHDALPIYSTGPGWRRSRSRCPANCCAAAWYSSTRPASAAASRRPPPRPRCGRCRSEEHTSELQSRFDIVCRLLLEKKKKRSTRVQY